MEYRTVKREAEAEHVEKKSRFIGQIRPVETQEQALAFLEEVRKRHREARHNVFAYLLRSGAERCSDDGEPQGTGGVPVLEVLRREGLCDVCCVVTRYFGGILLGTGGLTRAYSKGAKLALDAAGIALMKEGAMLRLSAPYTFLTPLEREIGARGGKVAQSEYAENVTLTVFLPEGQAESFAAFVTELTAGAVSAEIVATQFYEA
ncbi:YigZ family protein [Feifania hominis]|uniref:YigZ family protein n=1 Tax=Feifania hominis TaxID=2763660 RepID=A0A926DDB1_9FIRM|nr:YigZ family protein [Feifania hominis]MBC8535737.1 YigZ family protein [Feifania hominis]